MIVATAGHVDHGKTALVRALTGTDTDRLPEEQRRGMTIEPGHAHADFGGVAVAFVDVPGHERFMRQMLAGVAAVDFALLVVAADDGPMPQTLEHLAVLQLLGLRRGALVLGKIDRVDAARVDAVRQQVQALLAGGPLATAPVFALSARTGEGVDALRAHLREEAQRTTARRAEGGFRLAVDRSFVRAGDGRVVTGAVLSGSVTMGDGLTVAPAGIAVRVRGLQSLGRPVDRAVAGQRCALNLVPLAGERLAVERGDWVVAPALQAPTLRLDVALQWRPGEAGTASGPLQLHLGAAVREARLVLLDPGMPALAQLLLHEPVSALHGDRFILRDPAAQRVRAGGVVLDAFAPARGRTKPLRLADLRALEAGPADVALAALLQAHPQGIAAAPFRLNWNLPALTARELACEGGTRFVAEASWKALRDTLPAALATWHATQPESAGPDENELLAALRGLLPWVDAPLLRAALRGHAGVVREGFAWRLPAHRARLSEADAALLARVAQVFEAHGLRPPPPGELAPVLGVELSALTAFLERSAARGLLVKIAANRFFLPATLRALLQVARDTAAASPEGLFEVIPFRDRSGTGRNLAIQVLEFFDRRGLTRRVGNARRLTGRNLD